MSQLLILHSRMNQCRYCAVYGFRSQLLNESRMSGEFPSALLGVIGVQKKISSDFQKMNVIVFNGNACHRFCNPRFVPF